MIDKTLRTLAVVPTPTAGARSTPGRPERAPQAAAHPFAEVLRQNRLATSAVAAPRGDAKVDTPSPTPRTSAGDPTTPAEPAAPHTTRDESQARARAAGHGRAGLSSDPATSANDAATKAQGDDARTADDGSDRSTAAADPAANAAALASAQAAALRALPVAAFGTAGLDTSAGTDTGTSTNPRGRDADVAATLSPWTASATPGNAAGAATTSRDGALAATDAAGERGEPIDGDAASAAGSAGASFAGLLAESKTTHGTAPSAAHGLSGTLAPAGASNGTPAGGATATTAAATTTTLATPLHSPDFAAAFGMQVGVLAKDGVQRAELHLNPADMGPVSISITLDGTQARVDFGADMAATRHAIEAGLPELASALRDAGFTLAGGGVAQHSASNGGGQDGDAPTRTGRIAADRVATTQVAGIDAAAQRLARRAAAGGVDLYA